MKIPGGLLLGGALFVFLPSLALSQVGSAIGPANSLLGCQVTAAGTPEMRPEGYSELAGDIVISCTGGPVLQQGMVVPTANVILYTYPSVPVTSRLLASSGSASEALLLIDDPGSNLTTGATGGYGPQAPQSVCTSAQQQDPNQPCRPVVGVDNSGQYEVTVLPGTSTPAPNVYQGSVGDFGPNSVAFYSVPVLPPASTGVSRTFRITNIRVKTFVAGISQTIQAVISTSPNQVLPVALSYPDIGIVGFPLTATANVSPAGGGNPFNTCAPVSTPKLAATLTYTEGFATSFKTRVVPGANTTWAGEGQNLSSPSNQNIPGGLYGGFLANNESNLIQPGLTYTDSTSNVTYTAGLADFGTRLKAVFSNIPAGVTLYVSATSAGSTAIPGGTSVTPFAVLVAASQQNEANSDGTAFSPLSSNTTASDGAAVYPLTVDNNGLAAAVWEVVNSNPDAIDSVSVNVYIAYGSTAGTVNPTWATLSLSPEPGGGSFSYPDGGLDLLQPVPRFAISLPQGGPFATINACPIQITGGTPLNFAYAINGSVPSSRILTVGTNPNSLAVTVTPIVTTPSGGKWLSASLNAGQLTVSVNPANLTASPTAYTGTVQLSGGGAQINIPVNLTVYPAAEFTITSTHTGDFAQGQQSATYSVVVSNASQTAATTGSITVTESFTSGLSLVSMSGTGWNCNTVPTCTRGDSLSPAHSYSPITVTVNVAGNAASPQFNGPQLSDPGYLDLYASDPTTITGTSCYIGQQGTVTVNDLQTVINDALGENSTLHDLNNDGIVSIADIQLMINAVLSQICIV